MLLIFGTRGYATVLAMVSIVCQYCGVRAAQRVSKRFTRFTLFFIPTFAFGTRYENTCIHCGRITELSREQAESAQSWAAANAGAGAGTGAPDYGQAG